MRGIILLTLLVGVTWFLVSGAGKTREQLRIVGSSTVYPFVTAAAEMFGLDGDFKTPIVEATGTGGGFKIFCGGVGLTYPDINNASRQMKDSEVELCRSNGVEGITGLPIGYDGIVLASSVAAKPIALTLNHIFLALAREVPGKDGILVKNPYQRWNEIDASLPDLPISIYGPPPTSGTRDAFVELVMERACDSLPIFATTYPEKDLHKAACHGLREDGAFIEAGEDDNLIIQKLIGNDAAMGIVGYGFLEENRQRVQAATINGIAPSFENIETGKYDIARSLYVYVKNQHVKLVPGLAAFITELTSNAAIGPQGYVVEQVGLLPLHPDALRETQGKVKTMNDETMNDETG